MKLTSKILLTMFLLMAILSSGCVNVSVEQKLKRNGNYDTDLKISIVPEYAMLLAGIKEDLKVEDSVKNKVQYSETENSVIYSFKDINPETDKKLFKKIEKKEDEDNPLSQSGGSSDMTFLDPENLKLKKELKFPYYEYTYNLKIAPSAEKDKNKEVLAQEEYILDQANILNEQQKSQIIQSINRVYENDSIELVVTTTNEPSDQDYYDYSYEFESGFKFKNKNKQYILILVSTNQDFLCKIESNLYFEPEVTSKIEELNADFEKTCRTNYGEKTTEIVGKLDDFFKTTDLESSKQTEDKLEDLFKIGYTVQVFGQITDTNGLKIADNRVKFDINPAKNSEYKITFKDFFLSSFLGDFYLFYLIGAGAAIVIVVGVVIILKHKKKAQAIPPQVPLAINPQLVDYAKRARISGMNDEQIKESLIRNGWNSKDVDIALQAK